MWPQAVAVAVAAVAVLPTVSAQTSNATCTIQAYAWAYNSRQQSPCLVAAYMGGVCHNGQWGIPVLAPDETYLGPTTQVANPCLCSSIYYSLLSACADCYGRSFLKWSSFSKNCSAVYPSVFPGDIPSGTAVPAWAYLDVVTDDSYNATAALLDSTAPESTAAPIPTGTFGSTALPTPTVTHAAAASHKSVAGPVAGGVVGGLAFLAIVAGLVFWFLRRRRRAQGGPVATEPAAPYHAPLMSYNGGTTDASFVDTSYTAHTPKLYDPSDPSTFPSSPVTSTMYTTRAESVAPSSTGVTHHPGAYSGAAEL